MAMKKIKPQYGKVIAPAVKVSEEDETGNLDNKSKKAEITSSLSEEKQTAIENKSENRKREVESPTAAKNDTPSARSTSDPNPFLQTKEVFGKARLTKIGYRMRTDYVEILDIIKKVKKGGYTLEAVLDDAQTYYFENSEDGKEALKKAEIFYS